MTAEADAVAARYEFLKPGYALVDYEDALVPMAWVTLDLMVQHKKPVPPVEEFVLRAAGAGFDTVQNISGLLGLNEGMVRGAVATQWQLDNLDYARSPGDPVQRVRLTPPGQVAMRELETLVPERREVSFRFDRMLWEAVSATDRGLLRPREANQSGFRRLPGRSGRRPNVDDVQVDGLNAILKTSRARQLHDVEVLAVRNVVRVDARYEAAVLLVYRGDRDNDIELALAIDEHLSPRHAVALDELGGPARLSINEHEETDVLKASLPESLRVQAVPLSTVSQLRQQISEADTQARLAAQRAATPAEGAELPSSEAEPQSLKLSTQRRAEAQQQLEKMVVRSITTYEHRLFLQEALESSRRRLLIISPWITNAVVNDEFVRKLEAVLRRHSMQVAIGYGLGPPAQDKRTSPEAVQRLTTLAERYPNLLVRRLSNTHAKVLIWDNAWITTSFNWLSFRGDPERTYRIEEGILVKAPRIVGDEYERQIGIIRQRS